MTARVPELAALPKGLVLDGELVAFNAEGGRQIAKPGLGPGEV